MGRDKSSRWSLLCILKDTECSDLRVSGIFVMTKIRLNVPDTHLRDESLSQKRGVNVLEINPTLWYLESQIKRFLF